MITAAGKVIAVFTLLTLLSGILTAAQTCDESTTQALQALADPSLTPDGTITLAGECTCVSIA